MASSGSAAQFMKDCLSWSAFCICCLVQDVRNDGSASWVFFVHHSNLEVGGESQPCEQKRERSGFACTENPCNLIAMQVLG